VIGDRAYIATPQNSGRWFTNLRLFDVSDPTAPLEIATTEPGSSQIFKAPPAFWLGLPVDVTSEEQSALTGGNVVAVATNPLTYPYHASNVRLYDVTDDHLWRWIGAVSLGREPTDGMIRRIRLKGPTLYAVTAGIGKGIQVVDLAMATDIFDTATAGGEQSQGFWEMQGQLNSTTGFAQEAIVQMIHVPTGTGDNSQLWDLAVTDLSIFGMTQTSLIATGRSPLVIASQTEGLIYNGPITDGEGGEPLTSWGFGVAAGTVAGVPIAVVSAIGGAGPTSGTHVLAVVDLTNPFAPRALAVLPLPGSASAVQDVVLRDTTVFIGTNNGTLVITVVDPDYPQLIGTIPSISGRLAFSSEGLIYGTYRGLTQTTHAQGGLQTAALDTVVTVSVDPDYLLLNESGLSVDDLPLRLRVIPSADGVISERVIVRNEVGATLFSADVKPAADATVVYPRGQTHTAQPQHIVFEVRNADGQRSNPVTGQSMPRVLGPEVHSVTPRRVATSTTPRLIEIRGLRFTSFSRVTMIDLDGEEIELETQYRSSTRLDAIVPATVLGIIGDRSIRVRSGAFQTEAQSFKIVAPSNAVTPQVVLATPEQVFAGSEGEWVTINGSGFVDGDTVARVDLALGNLPTEVLSPSQLRTLVPPAFLLRPGTIWLQAVSSREPDLASDEVPVQVLGVVVSEPAPPIADRIVEDHISLMSGLSEAVRPLTIRGANFEPDAQVFTSIDYGPFEALATNVTSANEVRASLPRDLWRERYLEVSGEITRQSGTQATVKFVRKLKPSISIRTSSGPAGIVLPSLFHDGSVYLLDPNTGQHIGTTFKRSPDGFQLEVVDPSQPDLSDVSKAYVRLESKTSSGAVLDKIDYLEMEKFSGGTTFSKSQGEQIVAVTDAVDDGRIQATGTPRFGGEPDGSRKDPTIEVRLRGQLEVTYRNLVKNVAIGPVSLPVAPAPKRLEVRAYKVTTGPSGQSAWSDADILAFFEPSPVGSTSGPTAADIFAAAGIELSLASPVVHSILAPQGSSWHTPVPPGPCVFAPSGPRVTICPITGDYLDIIGQRQAADLTNNVVSVFFVDFIAGIDASGNRVRARTWGQAITDVGTFTTGGGPAPLSATGAAFIGRDTFDPRVKTNVPSNAKTVAHEIAHILMGIDPTQMLAGSFHEPVQVNILRSDNEDVLTLLKKRFDAKQRATMHSGKQQGSNTLRSRFIK